MTDTLACDAIMLCGGRGERLAKINPKLPKSLFKVASKELIRYSIDPMPPKYVERLILAVDYRAADLKQWAQDCRFRQEVVFSSQQETGVLAAIKAAVRHVNHDSFIVCNTDEVRHDINLVDMIDFHKRAGSMATMLVTKADNLHRHRTVNIDSGGHVLSTKLKPEEYLEATEVTGLVNTGLFMMNKEALEYLDMERSKDWSGITEPLHEAGKLMAYVDERVKYFNVGTPEEYYEAQAYLEQNTRKSQSC